MAVDPAIAHLLRRAGFGYFPAEGEYYNRMSLPAAIDQLVDFHEMKDTVDSFIGHRDYLRYTASGEFSPNRTLFHARQRALFRMVHSARSLQEKMALFWHNHFATGYGKIAVQIGPVAATRALAAKPSGVDEYDVRGQYELFREYALGNFRDLLVEVSMDPAMVAWLDGDTNVAAYPQENYARELMELFTVGVDHHTESDVYAGARVFTGWNLWTRFGTISGNRYSTFLFRPDHHDTDSKTFSFPIYPDGGRTIPARPAADGMQDGLDLINALAGHPETGPRLARKLYGFFVSELEPPPESFIRELADVYYASGYDMRAVVRTLLHSSEFQDPANYFARYSWPVEHVVRLIKAVGWHKFSADTALTALTNMGQTLFEPPDVAGWRLGADWFSTGTLLARMNFASTIASHQRFGLAADAQSSGGTPESLLAFVVDRMGPAPYDTRAARDLLSYVTAGDPWNGSEDQVFNKAVGLAHLIGGSPQYQFV